jgi:hypothetical protein
MYFALNLKANITIILIAFQHVCISALLVCFRQIMSTWIALCLCMSWLVIEICTGITSPLSTFATYQHSTALKENVADLWWTVNDTEKEIIFELHVKSTGWVALGISPGK